ncbi:hypothetical protein G6F46_004700 [Rhizopus delemar]|uniref:Fungal lipase-type domain-containing protein n=3 Tax=Rhizopus TaxID=4842 RepID=I1BYR2_RHIO9|nr:hypothetical protein RO3G_06047 [Rhizopus delemar RA 99-880]KAG1456503.1 hypothetical protein G6F55_006467 [Rhizopus delemar]KAG1553863.1 hypothetical protein G6F51_000334 [Rhizopus arrhizus]KAG1495494.1 hypothetical protein G6F54_007130 [Rhizopus delemar]KAG1509543.1 hypothetical protein G6F53_007366 [Rhizopus delemar]|eukprot:EIE81342.1 hypothetical protein RO3G_06047 [Rhizopus delemar RA 99-880]
MVSFISISQGISFCLLASSMMVGSSALPVAGQPETPTNSISPGIPTELPDFGSGNLPSFSLPQGIPTGTFPTTFPTNFPSFDDEQNASDSSGNDSKNPSSLSSSSKETSPDAPSNVSHLPKNETSIERRSGSNSIVMASSSQISDLKKYAGIASIAYCPTVIAMKQWNCIPCRKYISDGKLITTFKSIVSDTNGFVVTSASQKTIFLVFRGTTSYQQSVVDMMANFVPFSKVSGAMVHAGFYNSVKEVVNNYYPKIQSVIKANPDYKVVVTGHSLGGAQALIAGVDLYNRDPSLFNSKNVEIYTIGQPRVGNTKFAKWVDSTGISIHRSVHSRDVVPHVPPRTIGYLHVGVESWIKADPSTVQVCTSNLESNSCSDTVEAFTNVMDHLSYFGIRMGTCF